MNTYPLDYDNLRDFISKGKNKVSRPLANNTTVRTNGVDVIVKYHATDIAIFKPDGAIILNTGGWRTSTTKTRLSELAPRGFIVYQERGVWYLTDARKGWRDATRYFYADGITIHADGTVTGEGENPNADRAQVKAIQKYARGYIAALLHGEVPPPSGGDCWYCAMRTSDNKPLGEASTDTSHLDSHIAESYYVPSLIARAVEVYPVSIMANSALYAIWYDASQRFDFGDSILAEQGYKSLVKYLKAQYGLAR